MLDRAQELLAHAGVGATEVVPARDGREHHLFRVTLEDGTRRLLKFPREQGFVDPFWPGRTAGLALRAEAQAIGLIRFVEVPKPYMVLDTPTPAALMGIIPGAPPEVVVERGEMDPELLRSVCYEMGHMLAAVHLVRRPEDPGAITDLPGVRSSDARLLHMDFHLGNVIGDRQLGRRWRPRGVVDWTCCHWGPREADLGELGVSVFATNPAALDAFFSGYRRASGVVLNRPRVLWWMVRELKRRMHDDAPEAETVRNLWAARIHEWETEPGVADVAGFV